MDTNCLLASLPRKSPFRPLFEAILRGELELAVSTEILLEYAEIIEQKTNPDIAHNVMELLANLPNLSHREVWYRWNLITSDPDDNKFVDCAIVSAADYIVTHDRHFDVLEKVSFPSVRVISIPDFLALINSHS